MSFSRAQTAVFWTLAVVPRLPNLLIEFGVLPAIGVGLLWFVWRRYVR